MTEEEKKQRLQEFEHYKRLYAKYRYLLKMAEKELTRIKKEMDSLEKSC